MQIYANKSFSNPIEIIKAEGDLKEAFCRIDELRKNYYLLGYITYDFQKLYFEVFEIFAFAHAWFRMRNAAERIALHLVYCLYNIC